MFRPLTPPENLIDIFLEGRLVRASEGKSLAAALLQAGFVSFRFTPISCVARAPYCLMGVCFECLVEIDGAPNCQACMETVRPGMRIERQCGAANARSKGDDA